MHISLESIIFSHDNTSLHFVEFRLVGLCFKLTLTSLNECLTGNVSPVIRFNVPSTSGNEHTYVEQAMRSGYLASGGPFSTRCSQLLQEAHECAGVLMTTSCTDALELTALLLDIAPGDTVIVPSFTFTSTALAFARQGANLRFADIERRTMGIDVESVAALLDDSVRAVVCVHYAGIPCDVDGLRDLLAEFPKVVLIEDNAHGLFGEHKGQKLGTFGRFSTLSFHETKNFQCGEGGALLIRSEDDTERAQVLVDKGTNRKAFLLGNVDKYSWRDTGSSFGISDLQAAFLYAQLERATEIQAARANLTAMYRERLEPVAPELNLSLPSVPDSCRSAHHMFYVLTTTQAVRDNLISECKGRGVNMAFHYVPLHSSEAGRRFSDTDQDCPVSTDVSARLVRLPFYTSMRSQDVEHVVQVMTEVIRTS